MTPKQLLKLIRMLPEQTPIYAACKKTLEKKRGTPSTAWYQTQKEHLIGWLSECDGPGAYNRKNPKKNATSVYNNFLCPEAFLWLGEAAGIEKKIMVKVKNVVLMETLGCARQCGRIRKLIPWGSIATALLAKVTDVVSSKTKFQ